MWKECRVFIVVERNMSACCSRFCTAGFRESDLRPPTSERRRSLRTRDMKNERCASLEERSDRRRMGHCLGLRKNIGR